AHLVEFLIEERATQPMARIGEERFDRPPIGCGVPRPGVARSTSTAWRPCQAPYRVRTGGLGTADTGMQRLVPAWRYMPVGRAVTLGSKLPLGAFTFPV